MNVMTMLFGLVFHEEIGSNGLSIEEAFNKRYPRKLAEFANPHDDVVRKWRG